MPTRNSNEVAGPSESILKAKAAVRHRSQSAVEFTLRFLNGRDQMQTEDGRVVTIEIISTQELQSLIGNLPDILRTSVTATAIEKPQYNGPLKLLTAEQMQRLSAMVHANWSEPTSITKLADALNGEFQNCFKADKVAKITQLSKIINGEQSIFINGLIKSVNRASDAQVRNYCEQNKQSFLQWLKGLLEKEEDADAIEYLSGMLTFVSTSDFTNIEILKRITEMTRG